MATITAKRTIVDLRSDTVSQPTAAMRSAMANAVVGDDVFGEDATVNALESKFAKLFEKEAALFVSSGTMGNLISIMVHCNGRGEEAIVGDRSHVFLYEQGGAASIAGVQLSPIRNEDDGTYSLQKLHRKIRGYDFHEAKTRLAIVECTQTDCGGNVPPLQWIDEFAGICKERSVATHMDGARVFHAATYLNVPVSRITRDFNSATICLSKSLCAPVGSVMVGSKQFIQEARRVRKSLGGGMRQVGILAAAGIVALDQIVPKLNEDHVRLAKIAQSIAELENPSVIVPEAQTNILLIRLPDTKTAEDLVSRLAEVHEDELQNGIVDADGNGIIVKVFSAYEFVRFVVYHHITDALVELTIKKLQYCINEIV